MRVDVTNVPTFDAGDVPVLEVTVGPGGDYPTINAALTYLSGLRPTYESLGVNFEVRLLSGFVMAEQVFVFGVDLSYITIVADDAEVTISRQAMTNIGAGISNWRSGMKPAFTAMRGAGLPTIGALFSFDATGDGGGTIGVLINEDAHGTINRGCGVKNAGWRGLYTHLGSIYARETIWDGAGLAGGGIIQSTGAGIRISNGSNSNVRDSSAKGCTVGLYAAAAMVVAQNSDFSGSVVSPDATNTQGVGILAENNSKIMAGGCDVSGAERNGLQIEGSSRIEAPFVNASGCDRGVSAVEGYANVSNGNLSNCVDRAASLSRGSELIAIESDMRGTLGPNALRLFSGSRASIASAQLGASGSEEVTVSGGSVVSAENAVDNTGAAITANIALNTLTASGVVFR